MQKLFNEMVNTQCLSTVPEQKNINISNLNNNTEKRKRGRPKKVKLDYMIVGNMKIGVNKYKGRVTKTRKQKEEERRLGFTTPEVLLFNKIPDKFAPSDALTPREYQLLLLLEIRSLPNNGDTKIYDKTLYQVLNCSRATLQRMLVKLEKLGFIQRLSLQKYDHFYKRFFTVRVIRCYRIMVMTHFLVVKNLKWKIDIRPQFSRVNAMTRSNTPVNEFLMYHKSQNQERFKQRFEEACKQINLNPYEMYNIMDMYKKMHAKRNVSKMAKLVLGTKTKEHKHPKYIQYYEKDVLQAAPEDIHEEYMKAFQNGLEAKWASTPMISLRKNPEKIPEFINIAIKVFSKRHPDAIRHDSFKIMRYDLPGTEPQYTIKSNLQKRKDAYVDLLVYVYLAAEMQEVDNEEFAKWYFQKGYYNKYKII